MKTWHDSLTPELAKQKQEGSFQLVCLATGELQIHPKSLSEKKAIRKRTSNVFGPPVGGTVLGDSALMAEMHP